VVEQLEDRDLLVKAEAVAEPADIENLLELLRVIQLLLEEQPQQQP